MEIPERGPFAFGAPYNTLGIRVTNESDGEILPRTMAYWQNINAHQGRDRILVFLGTSRGPCLWRIDKSTHEVMPLGPLFESGHHLANSTAESWYWHPTDSDILYCSDDEHLYRYNVVTRVLTTVVDITPWHHLGCIVRQWHSSGKKHSATVRLIANDYEPIGTVVFIENRPPWEWHWFKKKGPLDESQPDKSGRWLLIKEQIDGEDGEDNRIIDLEDVCLERDFFDRDGAAGHSDNGYGYMVAADNWHGSEAAWKVWMFSQLQWPQGRVVYLSDWTNQVIHVSHCNARPGPSEDQWVLGSGTLPDLIKIPLNGSLFVTPIAPSMAQGDSYDELPKANLDPYGQYALWTRFDGRYDAFMVRINDV